MIVDRCDIEDSPSERNVLTTVLSETRSKKANIAETIIVADESDDACSVPVWPQLTRENTTQKCAGNWKVDKPRSRL